MNLAKTMSSTLATEFEQYSAWRNHVSKRILRLRDWMNAQELGDAETELRLKQLLDRLSEDRLNVAFVAEFSRGKSELINAIFFSDYRQRVLPSSAGRTTMCPTELYYEEDNPPFIRLLPIETKGSADTVSDLKRRPEVWSEFPLDIDSVEQMASTLQRLSETTRVPAETARKFGLIDPDDEETQRGLQRNGTVDIPRWRHALINFPHPLLKQGLVILDTPGLNAIGTEPELTLNLLPNAHAVLFILAADTGVTRSDIDIWRHFISPLQGNSRGRLVVLNKIDGLWDELKSTEQIDAEIDKQVKETADRLEIPVEHIYPVSAQKALVAKVQGKDELLLRSRMPQLEAAMTSELIPYKQELVRESTTAGIEDVIVRTTELIEARLANIQDQIEELESLRGKNKDVISHMMVKANQDKLNFDKGLAQFQALRNVFSNHAQELRATLGMETLRLHVQKTRANMEKSYFTKGMRSAMKEFFMVIRENMSKAANQVEEIQTMMAAMYRKFSEDHGLAAVSPPIHSMLKFHKEIQRLERKFDERFNTVFHMITQEQHLLTARFFETLANEVVRTWEIANRETEGWMRALMAPMDTQVREHQSQLKRRLESVKRIHEATETLDHRIQELETSSGASAAQLEALAYINNQVIEALNTPAQSEQPYARSA